MPDALTVSEARAQVLSEADWAPSQSDAFLTELDRYLWLAALRLPQLVPSLLHDTHVIYLQPPAAYASAVTTDRLAVVSGDRLVLERATTSSSRTAWAFDGRWDSRNLWVQDTLGVYYRFVAREFWTDSPAPAGTGNERVSLDKLYPAALSTTMPWWIFTDPYALRDDVVVVVEANLWDPLTAQKWPIRGITEQEMERLWRPGPPTSSTAGRPYYWSPGPRKRLQPPRFTPQVSNAGTFDASGDDTGQVDYRFTICWGRRDLADIDPHGNLTPVWESPASPASAKITLTAGAAGGALVTLPDLDYIAHYTGRPTTGSVRGTRSGYYLRLYRRRYTNTETTPLNEVAGYNLLAEVAADATSYSDLGAAQTVYEVPLRPNQDIPTIRFWPHPSQRYEVHLRVVRRPLPFYVPTDLIAIPPDASELLILDARRRLANKMQRPDIAAGLEAEIQAKSNAVNRANLQTGVILERGMVSTTPASQLDLDDYDMWVAQHLET